MDPAPLKPVGRTALMLAPIAVAARGVAFLVPIVIAQIFGVTGVTDAFFYALAFPTFMLVTLANALGVVITPALARVAAEEPDRYRRFSGAAATAAFLTALTVGTLILLVLWPLLPHITGFDAEVRRLAVVFVAELLPFMGLYGASIALRSSCEVRSRFVPAAVAPMLRGGAIIATLVLGRDALGAHALPVAMILGQAAEATWFVLVLAHARALPIPNLVLDARLRRVGADVLPILGGEVMVALNLVVDKAFAGGLAEGSVSLLEYADRARFIPWTLFEATLLPVAFATWANLWARGQRDDFARQIDQSLRWIAAWTAAPLAGLFIGRFVLASLLYERGDFTAAHAEVVGSTLGWYLPGMWSVMIGVLAMRAHVVERRLGLVLAIGAGSVALNVVLDALLASWGIEGLALATTLTWIAAPIAFVLTLVPTLRGTSRAGAWVPVLAVAAGALGVALAVEWGPGPPTSLGDATLWLAAVACFALLGAGAWLTRGAALR